MFDRHGAGTKQRHHERNPKRDSHATPRTTERLENVPQAVTGNQLRVPSRPQARSRDRWFCLTAKSLESEDAGTGANSIRSAAGLDDGLAFACHREDAKMSIA